MYDFEDQRRMPVFIFISMVLHALLFLIAPHVISGVFSVSYAGDQGGLTYLTLVDAAIPERPRAVAAQAARRPQATPAPRPLPEPSVPAPARTEPAPAPAPVPEQPRAPEVQAPAAQPEPRQQPEPPSPAPAPAPENPAGAPAEEATAALQPVLTASQGPPTAPVVNAPPRVEEPAEASGATAALSGPPARTDDAAGERSGGAEPGGTGATDDVPLSLPGAEAAAEPALPPMGESMIRVPGGLGYPKNAVGLISRPVTVEVAVIVDPSGRVVETVVTQSSGIDYIDDYSQTVASRGIVYLPSDEMSEIRVVLVYDPRESSLTHRVDGFIKAPPTVGSFAR